jgi:nucleotide-binding universal stress UspA family protein
MKKILIAFDGPHFSEGAFEFARKMNDLSPVQLTGVFLPQIDYSSLWSYSTGVSGPLFIPLQEDEDVATVEKNIDRFMLLCRLNEIDFRVHKDFSDFALPALKKETRFADLLILGSESFYEYLVIHEPGNYLKDAIHDAECPVLVVPEHFDFPEKNILAYDGSESSVYAIKQFTYLFPEFTANNTVLVYAEAGPEIEFPDEEYIEELCARHFDYLTMFKLDINPNKYFGLWSGGMQGAMLVSGAYGRSAFSQIFKKSFVSDVIREHKLPVFIAHR